MAQENGGRNARGVWRGIAADLQVQVRMPVFVAIMTIIALRRIPRFELTDINKF